MNSKDLAWKIRRHVLDMTNISRGSHIASAFSVADIIAVLYSDILKFDNKNPKMKDRDRLVLSKGHASAALYSALAESGFFPVDVLKTHYANGGKLCGHVSHNGVNGIECSTGSLGHGISIACGMALANKKDGNKNRVFAIVGDGECDEGCVWEAALFANHNELSNFTVIIDYNKMQSLDFCENTVKLEPLADKWRAFGWNVTEVDGHNHEDLKNALSKVSQKSPTVVIAHTIKGKGVSFMENNILWHYRSPQGEEYEKALKELEEQKK